MTSTPLDHYQILGVARDASQADIKAAHRRLVLKCHPDKVEDPSLKLEKQNEFQKVQASYEVLSDPVQREKYDEQVKLHDLRRAFAAQAAANTSAPRTPPRTYPYHVNIRTAESRSASFANASGSAPSKMYSQSAQRSWEEIRVPEDSHKTARRTASYDERSSSSKQENEWRRKKDFVEEEEEERERERERERRKEQQLRAEKDDLRRAEKDEERIRKEEKRSRKEEKKEKERKRDGEEKKPKPSSSRYVEIVEEDDPSAYVKTDKKKSSSGSSKKHKDGDRSEKKEKDKTRDKDRERERDRDHDRDRAERTSRDRSVSSQRSETAEEKSSRKLEDALKYIKTSQAKATIAPSLGRANTYTAGTGYAPTAPMPPPPPQPPAEEEDVARRSSARARRGSAESRTKEKLSTSASSSKKMGGPGLQSEPFPVPEEEEEEPYIVNAAPPTRHNLPRANTSTDREFGSREMPIPPRRADTYHGSYGEREPEPRGRHRSKLHPQMSAESDDDTDDGFLHEPKHQHPHPHQSRRTRSPAAIIPEYPIPRATVYSVNDGRSRREGTFRVSPERTYAKPAYTYVTPPVSSARVVEPFSVPVSKVKTSKAYTEKDINFAYRDPTWNGGVPA